MSRIQSTAALLGLGVAVLLVGTALLWNRVSSRTARTVRGEVTYLDRSSDLLYLQDESGGVRVNALWIPPDVQVGSEVEVVGEHDPEGGARQLHAFRIDVFGRRSTVKPRRPGVEGLAGERLNLSLIEVKGVVRSATFETDGRLGLRLRTAGQELKVRLLNPLGVQSESVTDATLRVRGVLETSPDPDGRSVRRVLLATQASDICIQQRPRELTSFALMPVRDLSTVRGEELNHRVRVRGHITRSASGDLELMDGTGAVILNSVADQADPQLEYEAWGFIGTANGRTVLEDAVWAESEDKGGPSPENRPVLTSVDQVRQLSSTAARRGYRVWLHGVVTFAFGVQEALFFQDKTGGIYVGLSSPGNLNYRAGQRVGIRAVTEAGEFAPILSNAVVTAEGEGTMPAPASAGLHEVFSGRLDSQWMELEGIVHEYKNEGDRGTGLVDVGGQKFRFFFPGPVSMPENFVDARVRVRGVGATAFNAKRQMIGLRMYVPRREDVHVVAPGRSASQLPIQPVMSLDRFSAKEEGGHRHRIQAVVTSVGRDGLIYLQDNTGALRAESESTFGIVPGDLVDAAGFMRRDAVGFLLSDASAVVLKHNVAVNPLRVNAEEIVEDSHEAQLVELSGILVDSTSGDGVETLMLRSGRTAFHARLERSAPLNVKKGSLLQLRGVSDLIVQPGRSSHSSEFVLLLRSRGDLRIIRSAPFWTSEWLGWVLVSIGGLTLLMIAWALVLRRQMKQQTRVIRKQLEEAEQLRAIAESASRAKGEFLANMSHEIRTPLNGVLGMTELALMEPLAPEVREYLETAQESGLGLLQVINDVLDISKIEAGQMTIEIAPLQLRQILEQVMLLFRPAASQKAIELRLGYPETCPSHFCGDALRIRQIVLNLVGNAMKFTPQGVVSVIVQCRPLDDARVTMRIEVRDTGIGISAAKQAQLFQSFQQADTSTTRQYGGTGLGLAISKQLVELMGGSICVVSTPGEGSSFQVELPLRLPDAEGEPPYERRSGERRQTALPRPA